MSCCRGKRYYYMQKFSDNITIIQVSKGDVNGDTVPDNIYLIGQRPFGPESPFVQNITIIIQDGSTNSYYTIVPKENAGYNPTIFLGDFTGDLVDDILLSIDSGGSGGYAFYYIYSFIGNTQNTIFDHEEYDENYPYTVTYMDDYWVEVKENTSNTYTIDIRYKGSKYLSKIYNPDGKLKEPVYGWVNPLGGLYPVDFQRDGVYGLYSSRQIAGRYNADALGYVQTSLEWDGKDFTPFFQTVGILG